MVKYNSPEDRHSNRRIPTRQPDRSETIQHGLEVLEPRLLLSATPTVTTPIADVSVPEDSANTLKIFLLAGQSNMVGQAYAYDSADTANWNIPTMQFLLSGTAASTTYLTNLQNSGYFDFVPSLDYSWLAPRDDAWAVHYNAANGTVKNVLPTNDQADLVSGIQPLSPGFGAGTNHGSMIGPELGMGIHLADAMDSPIFLFKSSQGGTTLGNDWRPPDAVAARGGVVGLDYTNTMNSFLSFLDTLDADLADDGVLNTYNNATKYEVSAVFWLQGWNEKYNDGSYTAAQLQAEYADNLVDLIHSIRQADPRIPSDLGLIIGESSDQNDTLNIKRAEATARLNAEIPNSAYFFYTDGMIGANYGNNENGVPFSTGWGYHFNSRAENYLEIGWKAGGGALSTGMVGEDFTGTVIDLSSVFSDTDDLPLTYSVTANTNAGLVSTSIVDSQLSLNYATNGFGTADITVRATDQANLWVEDTFTVTVTSVNDKPIVVSPIADVTVDENAPDTVIDLSNFFSDVEDASLTYTVQTNTNPSVVNASIAGSILTLDYPTQGFGVADLSIRATDSGGLYVKDDFKVTVNVINTAPIGNDDLLLGQANTPLLINVANDMLANDIDPDGNPLFLDSFLQAQNGTVVDNGDGTLTYTPDPGFGGNDLFTYTVTDNRTGYDTAIVSLAIHPDWLTQLDVQYTDAGPTVPGYVVNDIRIGFTGEWTGAQILTADLGPGGFYQHPYGSTTPPNAALVGAFPELAYDTFVANGGLTADVDSGVLEVGASVNLGGDKIKDFTDARLDLTWAPQIGAHPMNLNDYLIARMTIRNDINSTLNFLVATAHGGTFVLPGTITDGRIRIPPATFIPGDLNSDGRVEQGDLTMLLSQWGATTRPTGWLATWDGQVDQNEMDGLLANWGSGIVAPMPLSGTVQPQQAVMIAGFDALAGSNLSDASSADSRDSVAPQDLLALTEPVAIL